MKEYHSPATLRLSSVDNEYGLAIGAVVLWAKINDRRGINEYIARE